MDTVKEGIRRNLVEMLALSGKRNVDLAEACGVGKSAVSNWLSGKNSIDIELIPTICDFLNISVDEFFGRSKAMQPAPALSPDEQQLVDLYRKLDARQRARVMEEMRDYADLNGSRAAKHVDDTVRAGRTVSV